MLSGKAIPIAIVLCVTLLVVCVLPARAMEIRRTNKIVVASGETIDDTLVAIGDSVTIDGVVNGDLIVHATEVSIKGEVRGSVYILALQTLRVGGVIDGSLFGIAREVLLLETIKQNLYVAGPQVQVSSQAKIGGDASMVGQRLIVQGAVGRGVMAAGGSLEVSGSVGRNLLAWMQSANLSGSANIAGNFVAHVLARQNVTIANDAHVGGVTTIDIDEPEISRYRTFGYYFGQILWLIAAFVMGMLMFQIVPSLADIRLDKGGSMALAGGVGFLTVIGAPILAMLFCLTLIGIPIGLTLFMAWMVAFYTAKIIVAVFLGRSMLRSSDKSLALPLLAGLAVVFVAIDLPYFGGFANAVLTFLGMGALVIELFHVWTSPAVPPGLPETQATE